MTTASTHSHGSHPTTGHDAATAQSRESWDDVKARLQQRWGQIDSGDFESSGTWDDLVHRISQKTGETRQSVEQYSSQLLNDARVKAADWQIYAKDMLAQAKAKASGMASNTSQTAHEYTAQAQATVADQMHAAEDAVRRKPLPSVAYAFGLGALVGIMLGSSRR